ncbi:MAG: formimidoylglutamase [Bacteroidetes bacterium]|nr:formimidoylglutamase [Bacteroidota bacterium]
MYDLHQFLLPVNKSELNDDKEYNDAQIGRFIAANEGQLPDLDGADIVIAGINEYRGEEKLSATNSANAVRKQLYRLHHWHKNISFADIGNIQCGAKTEDSYFAVKMVVEEMINLNKQVIILGGSHDITLGQYAAYKNNNNLIEATVIDAAIDLVSDSQLRSENFLMEMLTGEPNFVRHYNHIGFQSFLVHPHILETMDKLRFDCFRVGTAREDIAEMEPVMRNSDMVSFDISAIKNSDSPASFYSPNGFTGEDACSLAQYAGMSSTLSSFGIYGYDASKDAHDLSAKQIAQMIWYFIDGRSRNKQEADINDTHQFNEFHTSFADVPTVFFQSKKTGRWWMQLPGKILMPCSVKDYYTASNNEIPERWLRAQERNA